MKIDFKFEHNMVKENTITPLGLMIECTAPATNQIADATSRAPKGVVFVIDRSGSMGGGRLELVKQTILDLISRLNRADFVSIVSFDDTVRIDVPMARVGDQNISDVRRRIGELHPGGGTNLELGYRAGIDQAARAGVETKIVLLSDGQANAGVVDPAALGQLAARVTEHLITTSTIGIGTGYDDRILDALASASHGNHFAAIELGEAVDGLTAEFDDLLNKTIANVRVVLELGPAFSGEASALRKVSYVRDFRVAHNKAVAVLGDLCSEEEKNFVFDLVLSAASKRDEKQQLAAMVVVSYIDVETGEERFERKEFYVDVVSADDYVEPARDENVVAEVRTLRLQEQKEIAIQLMREGRVTEAQAMMAELGAEYEHMLESMAGLSQRSRARMRNEMHESMSFSTLHGEEFIKRGAESLNRKRSDKPDPRKKSDN